MAFESDKKELNMAIMIGENFKVEADRLNIILLSKNRPVDLEKSERMKNMMKNRWGDKTDDDEVEPEEKANKGWRIEGYFGSLKNLVKFLVELEVKRTDMVSLEVLVNKIDELYALIDKVCPDITVSGLRDTKEKVSS